MALGFGVFRVERAAERFQSVVVRLFEILERDRKLLRALGYEVFQVALIGSVFNHQPAMLERPADAHLQLIFFEWLQNVVVGAGTDRFQGDGNVVHGCDHDYRDVRILVRISLSNFSPSISGMTMSLSTRSNVSLRKASRPCGRSPRCAVSPAIQEVSKQLRESLLRRLLRGSFQVPRQVSGNAQLYGAARVGRCSVALSYNAASEEELGRPGSARLGLEKGLVRPISGMWEERKGSEQRTSPQTAGNASSGAGGSDPCHFEAGAGGKLSDEVGEIAEPG